MAVNVTVYDLENYPDNNKTVTVNQTQVVPTGYEGDEQWVLSFSTTAYSDNDSTTAIQDIYVREIKVGWLKSSGFVSGPFVIGASNKTLSVKMDASSKYYSVVLDEGTYGGDSLADHIEEKIRAIPASDANWDSNDDSLAYLNASVEYTNGKFYIYSGSVAKNYTGSNRTSVKVTSSGVDTCYDYLGFNLSVDSQSVASTAVNETYLAQNYNNGATSLYLNSDIGASQGECLAITDNTNTDYFVAMAVSGTLITVASGVAGISNNYTSNKAKIQLLRVQDPDQSPVAVYDTVDKVTRWGIKSMTNQIDFSS